MTILFTFLNLLCRKKILFCVAFSLVLETPLSALAQTQINPDGTLPSNVNNLGNGVYEITGGAKPNNATNLFHSLSNFSIQSGDTARFVHDAAIQNIITRITGGSPSNINGTIQTLINGTTNTGNANLFIINPKGIIFGENARLNIGGSFIGSTADSLKFADGTEFSATNPTTNPILTISIPLGLQYGANPGSIKVQGVGNNLTLRNNALVRNNRPVGLQVPNGKTLALVGGDVALSGGNLTAGGGRIDLLSVKNGQVSLVNSNGQLQLVPEQGINYGNIELAKAVSVDTSGNSGGSIQVRGSNVTLLDGSVIVTDTLGNGSGGTLNVWASDSLTVKGFVQNPKNQVFSALLADVAPGATGEGGKVFIETKTLQVTDGGQISSGTFGVGNAGELSVKAQNVQLSGISAFGPSGLFTPVAPGARGRGGNLTLDTGNLQITNGAQILASTFGFGDAGQLTIKAENVEITGGTSRGPSLISAAVGSTSAGKGGNLIIETENLRVVDGAQVAVSTSGAGNAGNMQIKATSVELVGSNQFGRSGLFANAIRNHGQGGDLSVTANKLVIRDGATINVSNFLSSDPDNLRGLGGRGAAGNIEINSPFVLLVNQGTITADTNAGNKGNITIQSQNLQMRQGSRISTNARNSSDGGNINITTDTLVAFENSDITANAQKGFGGRVVVNTKGIFGTEFSPQLTPESDITASSDLGAEFNGTVELNTPDVDPSQGLVKLPGDFSDRSQQIASGCATAQQNRFVVSNRGGLPANPTETLRDQTAWNDVRDLSAQLSNTKATSSNYQPTSNQQQLVEAQGLIISADGTPELVAAMQSATPQAPWQVTPQCSG